MLTDIPSCCRTEKREKFEAVTTGIMSSATGFSSNVADLVSFYKAHFIGNNILFPDSIKREMQRIHLQSKVRDWGFGFFIDKNPVDLSMCSPGETFAFVKRDDKILIGFLSLHFCYIILLSNYYLNK